MKTNSQPFHFLSPLLCASAMLLAPSFTRAQSVVVGVNLVNAPYNLTPTQQETILSAMQDAGVRVIRASIPNDDKGMDFAQRVYAHGIKIEWLISVTSTSGNMILSEADPEKFRTYFQPVISRLENKGMVFPAIELGNELNWSNHDLGAVGEGSGRIFGTDDLLHDPKGQKIARGYLQYIKVLGVLKDIRDHSQLNQHTPILSGMSSSIDPPGPITSPRDAVGLGASIRFLRANGMDNYVDGYAVHWYPLGSNQPPAVRLASLRQALAECQPSESGSGKPCWVTEFGLPVASGWACPVNDARRTEIFSELRTNLKQFAGRGVIKGAFMYEWEGDLHGPHESPYAAFLCGSVTRSGRVAIAPF
jgi:hypothetical protein